VPVDPATAALTAVEALQLAEQLGRGRRTERYRALLLVFAYGGLRFGEATALRRSDVLAGGRLRIERSVRRIGGRWVVGEPKTDAGRRTGWTAGGPRVRHRRF
jgi:integrase